MSAATHTMNDLQNLASKWYYDASTIQTSVLHSGTWLVQLEGEYIGNGKDEASAIDSAFRWLDAHVHAECFENDGKHNFPGSRA